MTTINILILGLSIWTPTEDQAKDSARRAVEKRDQEMADTAAAQMETANKAVREILTEDPLFTAGFWICDRGDTFGRGQYRSPRQCPVCESRLFKWVPGR